MVRNEILNLVSFFRKPKDEASNKTTKEKLVSFVIILIINLLLMILVSTFFYFFKDLLDDAFKTHKIKELFEKLPTWSILLLGVVIAPISEEFVFRFFLKYRKWSLYVFLPILLSIVVNMILWILKIDVNPLLIYIICLIAFVILNYKYPTTLKNVFKYKFHYLFYFVSILFALVHIQNFTYSNSILVLIPILVLPQFISGSLMGYLRVKFGFIWGVLLHVLNNAIFMIPLILSLNNAVTKTTIDTEQYYLNLTENSVFNHENEYSKYSIDSIVIKNYTLKKCLIDILDKKKNLIEIKNNSFNQFVKVNINYKSKNPSNLINDKENILKVLKNVYNFSIQNEEKAINYNSVFVIDSLLFDTILTSKNAKLGNLKKSSSLYKSYQTFRLINATPKSFSKILSEVYDKEDAFIFNMDKNLQFSLEAEKIPFNKLKSYLEKRYGLSFKKIIKNEEVSSIDFR